MVLTAAQLATHMNVSVRHVERCAAAGMPSISVGARAKRYDPAACLAWLAENSGALSTCQSTARPKAGSRSLSASAGRAYTDACRLVQVRVTPSKLNPS
jgi:hypothetical protein